MKKVLAVLLIIAICAVAVYFFTTRSDNDTTTNLDDLFDDKVTTSEENKDADKSQDEAKDEEVKKEEYVFEDTEKQKLISKYIEAENFYYDMLCQNFELDNMDVITLEADGYSGDYHRVLLVDVNSLSELKATYLAYFTDDFVNKLDFSAYHEENGKLYCAQTAAATNQNYEKYTCTAESTDGKTATLTRKLTDGSSSQKITAKSDGNDWFFDGVAIR